MIISQYTSASRALLAFILTILPLAAHSSTLKYIETNARTFPETGKTVQGKFLEYWDSHGGLSQQGYPISEELEERSDTDGKTYTVQYFERSVFEMHPENQPPYDVLLSLLGVFAYKQRYPSGAPGQHANTSPGSVSFPETGHRLGGQFLEYWTENGGLMEQGYPISDEFSEVSPLDGKTYTVQYFERSVFEMHPENQPPYDILLAQLGTYDYQRRYLATPSPTATATATATTIPTATSTRRPTGTGDWPMYGHDWGHTSYNPDETALSIDTVGQIVPRWQVNLGSNGNPSSGTPSVANGRVYVGSSAPTGHNFFMLDAVSGAVLWGTSVGYFESCDGVGIGSTAAISGTVVAVGGGDAAYYGLDAQTGAELWREQMAAGASGFAWESPLLAHGRAYLGIASDCDNPSVRGEIRAVEMQTGELLARQYFVPEDKAGAGIWNSPALTPDGGTLVAATGEDFAGFDGPYNRAMVSLNPLSLDILQANKQGATDMDQDFATSPIVFHDQAERVLVGASHKGGKFYAYALNSIGSGPIWTRSVGDKVGMLPAYDEDRGPGGTLFFMGSNSLLYAVDPATGDDRWTPVNVGSAHGNLAVANGLIYVNVGNGGVKVLDESDGKLLRTLLPSNPGPAFSGVVVSRGFVYWLSGPYLNAWSLPAP